MSGPELRMSSPPLLMKLLIEDILAIQKQIELHKEPGSRILQTIVERMGQSITGRRMNYI